MKNKGAVLGFILCVEGTTGRATADTLMERMGIFGLRLNKLRGTELSLVPSIFLRDSSQSHAR
jgi:hypothetical protein